ncbi:MAG TPA: translational GTPase TypA [Thermohalobaculum sp.]|nr:translational GTPase TypA [Thermohalobaculum sp.]
MDLRNIAIIAHVDHGKTTLVDELLRQSGAFREGQVVAECAMDSNALERERGITILAKCTSLAWRDGRINIVDTPGHADFGGEVERILSMVDGVVLLVDAAEGPMPQTKFVTAKALALGLRPIVVLNKVDRPDAEPDRALDEVFDMFAALGADDDQLDFPALYASGRSGWAARELDDPRDSLAPLFDLVLAHVPAPRQALSAGKPFRMLATTLEADPYLGRLLTGRIEEGAIQPGATLKALSRDGREIERFRVSKVLAFRGLGRQSVEEARAGDIVALAGMARATVADTLVDPGVDIPLPAQPIDPPTISVTFGINDSPLAGRDGKKVQSRVIRERLMREAESNVAIRVRDTEEGDAFEVSGRGELQMGVLIENMRREGFELSVSRPRVITREEGGQRLEPVEEVTVDVDDEYSGVVVEGLGQRRGEVVAMRPSGQGKTRLVAHVPSRGLIGYHGEFLTETRGTGVLNRVFHGWAPWRGPIAGRRNGVLISMEDGDSVAYALWNLEERGRLFIGAGERVYQGMIIGEHSRGNDLEVNPLKGKKLTNIRAAGKDDAVALTPPVRLGLEQAIAYVDDDELVEVTPRAIRLRKRLLDPHARKREARREQA